MRSTKLAAAVVLAASVVVLASACGGSDASTIPQPTSAPSLAVSSDVIKPKPVVVSVNANTAGMFDDYYAILDVTVTNEGADGMLIVVGSITQGSETATNDMPMYLAHNDTQSVRMIFPLEWKGGDWTPRVQTVVP